MRWLRGAGIEIGAGSYPTRLFGNATAVLADKDPSLKYGGDHVDAIFSLDDPALLDHVGRDRFDFAIASHVLEHLDSTMRGLENLVGLVRPGGVIYIAVPIKEYLYDKHWMPVFPFEHHVAEYAEPLKFADAHDALICGEHHKSRGGTLTIDAADRFQHHKHNYDFHDWWVLLLRCIDHLHLQTRVVDASFGGGRQDVNFVFERAVVR
jgi:SAM-dependent methyltransferase